jgi:hypothetical protein
MDVQGMGAFLSAWGSVSVTDNIPERITVGFAYNSPTIPRNILDLHNSRSLHSLSRLGMAGTISCSFSMKATC